MEVWPATSGVIFIFGTKPNSPSSQYGYFLTKKISQKVNKVVKFIEKPNTILAKKIIGILYVSLMDFQL